MSCNNCGRDFEITGLTRCPHCEPEIGTSPPPAQPRNTSDLAGLARWDMSPTIGTPRTPR